MFGNKVEALIQAYPAAVNVKVADSDGTLPLQLAVVRVDGAKVVALLLKYGVDASMRDKHEDLPLHFAVSVAVERIEPAV